MDPKQRTYGLADIAEFVSNRVAARLLEVFPGVRVYIPETLNDGHKLNALGEEEAAALVAALPGARITVPMSNITPGKRRHLISKYADDNMTREEIALATECCERRVYQVLQELKREQDNHNSDDTQLPLL